MHQCTIEPLVLKKTKKIYGETKPRDINPYPFLYHFRQRKCSFHMRVTSFDKWYHLHILVYNWVCFLTAAKALSFKYE